MIARKQALSVFGGGRSVRIEMLRLVRWYPVEAARKEAIKTTLQTTGR